jgi:hypothetical protein
MKSLITSIFIISINLASSQCEYNFTYQNTTDETGRHVINTNDAGYLLLKTQSNSFDLIKTDSIGNISWQVNHPIGNVGRLTRIKQTTDGGFIGIGQTNLAAYNTNQYSSIVVLKFNSQGGIQWSRSLHGISYGENLIGRGDILENANGEFIGSACIQRHGDFGGSVEYVAAIFKLSSTGTISWNRGIHSSNGFSGGLFALPNNIYLVVGRKDDVYGASNTFGNIFLAKYDNSGNQIFLRTYDYAPNVNGNDENGSAVVQINNEIFIAGRSQLNTVNRQVIIRCDAQGNEIEHFFYDNGTFDDLTISHDNFPVAIGSYNSNISMYKVSTTDISNIIWNTNFGGNQNDSGSSIELCSNNDFLVAGTTSSFGNGGFDAQILRFLENGQIRPLGNTQSETNIISCESYSWNNQIYTQSGQYLFQTSNAAGCDSIAVLNLTINEPTSSLETVTSCKDFVWNANNQSYTQSGQYTAILTDAFGCDSTVTLDLTIVALEIINQPINQNVNIDDNAVFSVTTSDPNVTFQWQTDLGLGFQNLTNAGQYSGVYSNTLIIENTSSNNNNQLFRCVLTTTNCSDTSNVVVLNVSDNLSLFEQQNQQVHFYPNPTSDLITLKLQDSDLNKHINIINSVGKVVLTLTITSSELTIDVSLFSKGVYFVALESEAPMRLIICE